MFINLFVEESETQSVELPDDCPINEPDIKQFLVELTKEQENQTELVKTFNSGAWELTDDDGNFLMEGKPKRQITPIVTTEVPSVASNDIMTKVEILQNSQSEIKALELDLANDKEALGLLLQQAEQLQQQAESKEQVIAMKKAEQQVASQDLKGLQQLLNELLSAEPDA
jgi:hypothetical protein